MKRLLLGLAAWLAVPFAMAQDMPPQPGWHQADHVVLDVDFPEQGYHARWDVHRCDCGDILIAAEQSSPDAVERMDMLLVGNRLVLVRGADVPADELAAQVEAPALMLRLALDLLARAAPGGVDSAAMPMPLNADEARLPIVLQAGEGSARFAAPWQVRGRVLPVTDDTYQAEFGFEFGIPVDAGGGRGKMDFIARMAFDDRDFPLAPGDPLDGWQAAWVRGQPDAGPAADAPLTSLGELRAWVRAN